MKLTIKELDKAMKDYFDRDINGPTKKPLSLKMAIISGLEYSEDPKNPPSPEVKYKRHRLADKLFSAEGEIALTNDEVSLAKEACQYHSAAIYGRIVDIIDPDQKGKK